MRVDCEVHYCWRRKGRGGRGWDSFGGLLGKMKRRQENKAAWVKRGLCGGQQSRNRPNTPSL